jgi:hypothetical protein
VQCRIENIAKNQPLLLLCVFDREIGAGWGLGRAALASRASFSNRNARRRAFSASLAALSAFRCGFTNWYGFPPSNMRWAVRVALFLGEFKKSEMGCLLHKLGLEKSKGRRAIARVPRRYL